jgi:hypothetical protein
MNVGRNDPCPCGSGKKYKKCCGLTASLSTPPAISRADAMKALDRTLVERLMRFSKIRLGPDWLQPALDAYIGSDEEPIDNNELQLAIPWAIFDYTLPDHGISLSRLYAKEKPARLSPDLQELLDAQLAAWLSIWQVKDIERGVGAQVVDLLTHEERFVHEVLGTSNLDVRSALLGRVVDAGGISFFSGTHPQPLPPRDADVIARDMKKICRVRTRPVNPLMLQLPDVQLEMIDDWRGIASLRRNAPPPTLTNTDGDLISPTTDHFDILTPDRSSLLTSLASFQGAHEPEPAPKSGEVWIEITKHGNAKMQWDNTIIGRIVIAGKRMRVESNSARRADSLKATLVSHLGELVKHRLRDEASQDELFRLVESMPGREGEIRVPPPTEEMTAILRAHKERYMSAWPDMEIPALGGLTPREAAKSPRSRADLELLVREMEMQEARLPEGERFDVSGLRDTLGMSENE